MKTIQIDNAPPTDDRSLDDKLADLERILGGMGRVLVGYSGGVDSAMLIVAAHRVLGENAIAVTADSESYANGELERATEIVRQFGIRHEVVQTRELDNPDYASNPINRCYYCKAELFTHMQSLAEKLGVDCILYGNNADDVGDFRPGSQAASDFGVRAPLQEAGLTKQDVRNLARRWGVASWNRPAMACLSSRFPYGTPVTSEGLARVDSAESYLRGRGFDQLRVRHHTDLARLELPGDELDRLLSDPQIREDIATVLTELGYVSVTADLRGFRSGSLNEVLKKKGSTGDDDDGEADLEDRSRAALADLDVGEFEAAELHQVLVLRLTPGAVTSLADSDRRTQVVEHLESEGARYVALDLVKHLVDTPPSA